MMRTPDALPPPPRLGLCLGCGVRAVLCAFGQCAPCHQEAGVRAGETSRLSPPEIFVVAGGGCSTTRFGGA